MNFTLGMSWWNTTWKNGAFLGACHSDMMQFLYILLTSNDLHLAIGVAYYICTRLPERYCMYGRGEWRQCPFYANFVFCINIVRCTCQIVLYHAGILYLHSRQTHRFIAERVDQYPPKFQSCIAVQQNAVAK